ncbi:MAG TPA: hypothetical protein VFP61_00955 [Acidimicrobiales bacterium]|nr:hypothetical protein [Acidimicrobiales bacterium]
MARRRSFTSQLYRVARLSAGARAASRGPKAVVKRQVRRRVYRTEGTLSRRLLRSFGL